MKAARIHTRAGRVVSPVLVAVVLAAAVLGLAACGAEEASSPAPTTTVTVTATATPTQTSVRPSPTSSPLGTMMLSLYFVRGEDVGTAHRYVPFTQAPATAAMKLLLAGPNAGERAAGLSTAIPAGTRLLGVSVSGGVATVDLTSTYASGGGTLSMSLRLAQVVYTLTQFPTVTRGVLFRLDGKPVTVFSGEGIVLEKSQRRSDFEDVTPPIFVETPAVGDTISSPVKVAGTANVFEAVFHVKLVAAGGEVLAKKMVQATSGTGTRGTFKVWLTFTTGAQRGRLVAWEVSMKDGSPINVIRIPLQFD